MSTPQKRAHNSDQFPILGEVMGIRVYKNPCGELFVEDIESGVQIRINRNHHHYGGLAFTNQSRVEPVAICNMIVWHVGAR